MTAGAGAVLALMLGLTGCASRLTTAEKGDIRRWLLCEECTEGELKRVVALDDRAVPALAEALRGPSDSGRNNMRVQTAAVHARIGLPAIAEQEYSNHYESNYIATYQLRAIRALAAIATKQAHAALVAGLAQDSTSRFRADVRRALGAAAKVDLSVVGDTQHAAVNSLVRVDPVVLVRDSTTGQGLSNVAVAFRVDAGGGSVSDSLRLTDSTGQATVKWRMGDSATVNVLRVIAGGRLRRLRAFGHAPGLRVVFLVQPVAGTVGQPLAPPPRIAVQDAWGTTQANFNRAAQVDVLGLAVHRADTIVAGQAVLSGLVVPAAGVGFRINVSTTGATEAVSDSFDITP
jgi:hypothetical protein